MHHRAQKNPAQRERGLPVDGPKRNRLACAAKRCGEVAERRGSLSADRGDRDQADDDDQGQHHSVFDCGGAVFRREKPADLKGKATHSGVPSKEVRGLPLKT